MAHPISQLLIGLAFISAATGADTPAAEMSPSTAEAAPITRSPAADTSGFLYGRVETRHDVFEGRLIWPRDHFWNDFLEAMKSRRPHLKALPKDALTRTESFEVFGRKFEREKIDRAGRSLRVRFGDIARLDPHSRAWTTVVLRDGSRVDAESGRDIARDLIVVTADGTSTRVEWERIRAVIFLPTPSDLDIEARRLFGTITYRATDDSEPSTVRGYFRWDRDESTTLDVLDGHTEDGEEHEIAFADIRRLEASANRTRVTLADGRELVLGGTNDVDRSNRGLDVERPGKGRWTLEWPQVIAVDIETPEGSGPSYDDFPTPTPLDGTVTTVEGEAFAGHIAFDADEDATWEILDLVVEGGEVAVAFEHVASIERQPDDATADWPWHVTLRSGEVLQALARDDLGSRNPGVVIYRQVETSAVPSFVPWDRVARIDLERTEVQAEAEPPTP